ncbi:MAG: hypothetical protein HY959_04005 [Ignavibacteriae bacterium]|nr:hypothetical protein [Ignavibacteriota bacterium]
MPKAGNNILVLVILLATVFTLDAHDFTHHHEGDSGSQCYACLISPSLISDEILSAEIISAKPDTEIYYSNIFELIPSDSFFCSISDRAPPVLQ